MAVLNFIPLPWVGSIAVLVIEIIYLVKMVEFDAQMGEMFEFYSNPDNFANKNFYDET